MPGGLHARLCHSFLVGHLKGWLRCTVVERRSLVGELSLSQATIVDKPSAIGLQVSQPGQLSLSSFRGR